MVISISIYLSSIPEDSNLLCGFERMNTQHKYQEINVSAFILQSLHTYVVYGTW